MQSDPQRKRGLVPNADREIAREPNRCGRFAEADDGHAISGRDTNQFIGG